VKFMTAEQQGRQVAATEAPAVRGTEAHTSSDHRATSPATPAGAKVTAPFKEAASLPAPSLEQKR
jgi:hypothetical protein